MKFFCETFLFVLFFYYKDGKKRCKNDTIGEKNDTIDNKKFELDSIIKEFREIITMYKFRFEKEYIKILRKSIRDYEKIVNDESEDDIEYLKDQIK